MSETDSGLTPAELIEHALLAKEGMLSDKGALIIRGGQRTGRSPLDSYIVDEPSSTEDIWWNPYNQKIGTQHFDLLWDDAETYLAEHHNYESALHISTDTDHYLPVRVITDSAWQNLYAHIMFIHPEQYNHDDKQEWELLCTKNFRCDPQRHQTSSDAAVVINFAQRKILIVGMEYAGEIKRSLFCVAMFLLPEKDILPLHSSANADDHGNTCLFIGLSGTGKTTLSADPDRQLIGDDEHAWDKGGLFNLEGGCYAKTIGLNLNHLPGVVKAIRFGSIAENVGTIESGREIDFEDASQTENTRCAYPLSHMPNWGKRNVYAEPESIILLCCDLYGVLPAISILSKEAAEYHFLSGYTARLASTENDHHTPLSPVFSTCYGAPFLTRRPEEYGELLMKRMEEFGSKAYLLNVGWHGASYLKDPNMANRYSLNCTKTLVKLIQSGELLEQPMRQLDALNLSFPEALPAEICETYQISADPREMWDDQNAYEQSISELAQRFRENFQQFDVDEDIAEAGPPRH